MVFTPPNSQPHQFLSLHSHKSSERFTTAFNTSKPAHKSLPLEDKKKTHLKRVPVVLRLVDVDRRSPADDRAASDGAAAPSGRPVRRNLQHRPVKLISRNPIKASLLHGRGKLGGREKLFTPQSMRFVQSQIGYYTRRFFVDFRTE